MFTKLFGREKGVCTVLVILALSAMIGVAFFPQDARSVAKDIDESIFLPLIFKSIIYQGNNKNIYWEKETAPYPLAYSQAVTMTVANNDYLYLIGGGDVNLQSGKIGQSVRVAYTTLNEDGTLGNWDEAEKLPGTFHGASATAVNGLIYVLGGIYFSPREVLPDFNNNAYCAKVNPDGTFEWETKSNNWDLFSSWFKGVAYHSTVVVGDRIYIVGGFRRKQHFDQTWQPTRFVLSAKVGDECQDLNWEVEQIEDNILPPLMNHTAVSIEVREADQIRKYVYVMGGEVWEPCINQATGERCEDRVTTKRLSSTVYRAEISGAPGESVGLWENMGNFTADGGLQLMTAVQSGDYIYVLGGTRARNPDTAPATGCIYRAKILSIDGEISPWDQLNKQVCELTLYGHTAVVSRYGRIYVVGGAQVTKSGDIPAVSDTIYWTPLAFLSKTSSPDGTIYPGDQVTYHFTAISNNVRDLHNVEIKDMLPSNLQLVSAPGFIYDGLTLTSDNFELSINHLVQLTFTAVVSPLATLTPNGRPTITTPKPELQAISTPEIAVQPIESNIRPTQVKGCVEADVMNNNGTPRPKPTCTPTPPVTVTITPITTTTVTVTPTDIATPTVTTTVTVPPTPTPEPVFVLNQALLCFEGRTWCKMATAVNAPSRTYLPLVFK